MHTLPPRSPVHSPGEKYNPVNTLKLKFSFNPCSVTEGSASSCKKMQNNGNQMTYWQFKCIHTFIWLKGTLSGMIGAIFDLLFSICKTCIILNGIAFYFQHWSISIGINQYWFANDYCVKKPTQTWAASALTFVKSRNTDLKIREISITASPRGFPKKAREKKYQRYSACCYPVPFLFLYSSKRTRHGKSMSQHRMWPTSP